MNPDPEWDEHEREIRERVYANAPDFIKAIIDDTTGGASVDIEARLRHYFLDECRVPTVFATMDEFTDLEFTPSKTIGIEGPHEYNEGEHPLFIVVCVPYLELLAAGWGEADTDLLVEIVCFLGSELLITWASQPDPVERFRQAEEKLFGHGPETARVLKAAGLRAMELADWREG